MDAAVGPTREQPDDERVDVAEDDVAALGLRPYTVDVLEEPLDLRPGEVRGDRQAGLRPEAILTTVFRELVADLVGARVLPDDRVVDGFPARALPGNHRLAMVLHSD